jgi:hypothetical protein
MANKSYDIYHKKFIVTIKSMDDPAKEEAVKSVYLALLIRFLPLGEYLGGGGGDKQNTTILCCRNSLPHTSHMETITY